MATLTSKLIIELLDRATGPARAISGALSRISAAQVRNAAALASTQTQLLGAAAAGYALAKSISTPVKAAIDFESAMADVKKVVDFETPQSFAKMGDDLLTLSKRIPIVAKDLAAISAAAGAAGMKENEILAFTEMVAKLATAFDMTAAQAGDDMAKIKTGLGYTVEQASALADAMNYLSNNVAAKAPQLIDYMKRVGVQGKQYGFSAEQTAALGAAMIAAGAESEVAATSFRNVGRALTKGNTVTKNGEAAFKQLGLTSMKVTKAMQKDAVGTFRDVLARIAKLPKHLQASVISTIFGDEARAIAPLIDNVKLLDDVLGMVSDRTKYLGSAQKEFEARTATTANAVQLFKNRLNVMSVTIGAALLPALNDTMKALHPFIEKLSQFAKDHPGLTRAVIGTSAALIGLRIAGIAAKWGLLWMWGGALATAAGAMRGLAAAVWVAHAAMLPFGAALRAVRSAMIGFAAASAIVGSGGALKIAAAAMLGMLNPIKLVRAALVGLRIALIGTGIGAVLLAIGAAGAFIYQNWSGIKAMFSSFGSAFMKAVGPVMSTLRPLVDAIGWLKDKITAALDALNISTASWVEFGRTLGTAVGGAVTAVVQKFEELVAFIAGLPGRISAAASGLYDAGVNLLAQLWEGMKAKFAALLNWVSNIGPRIRSAIGLGGSAVGAATAAKPAIAGARATGGPVQAGRLYLTSERGPELFAPNVSGHVFSAADTLRLLRGQGGGAAPSRSGGGGGVVMNNTFNIQGAPGQSAESIAEHAIRLMSDRLNALSRGSYSDGAYA
ncbi:phage tail tape measure protein [Rhodopseudomonas palustris]|uniref:Phage tail tape measure protein n=1 Tax=Rhodopseudomonas palustris TaxID=1076 RepID=A0A323UID5_RHOPL|nr:phage tail tape measure protein [Rhodopseudomonas palustris]PZA12752.1 phage tail tape measure protein [Rhodopseudomonas palustris]